VKGRTVDEATAIITPIGFTKAPIPVQVDGLKQTAGQVMGTVPGANETVAVDTPIQIQVSEGNQFTMPPLQGQFWDAAEPYLRSLGWTGELNKLPNAQNSGVPSNGVVTQSPSAGTPLKFGDSITISFAQ